MEEQKTVAELVDEFVKADATANRARRRRIKAHDALRVKMYELQICRIHRRGKLIEKDTGSYCRSGKLSVENILDVTDNS